MSGGLTGTNSRAQQSGGKQVASTPNAVRSSTSETQQAPQPRALTGDDAKRVEELEKKIEELRQAAKYTEAEAAVRTVLEIRRRGQGEEHWETSETWRTLRTLEHIAALPAEAQAELAEGSRLHAEAMKLHERGRHAEGVPLLQRALAICRLHLGQEQVEVANAMHDLAFFLKESGKYAEGEPLYRQALAIKRKVLGEDHPHTATSYNDLARNLTTQGRYAEAEPLDRRALAIFSKVLGEDHPHTATIYNNMAANLNLQGKHAEAEPLYRQALSIKLKVLGEDHPDTAGGYNNLADDLNYQGKYPEAENLWAQAAQSFEIGRWRSSRTGLERASSTVPSPLPSLAACRARLGQPAAAWRSLEAGLARGLLDDITAQRTQSLNADQRQRLEAVNARLDQINRQITALLASKEKAVADTARYRELAAQRQTATAELDRFAADRAAREIYELERIQTLLPADTALIAWVDVKSGSHAARPSGEHWACVLRQTGAPVWVQLLGRGARKAWTEEDEDLPSELRLALARPPSQSRQDWQEIARQTTAQRLAPLEPYLQGVRHLVVLSAWKMAGLPVEALTDCYTVSYAPSATLLARLQEKRRKLLAADNGPSARASRLLALGDPVFAPPALARRQPEAPPPGQGVLLTQVAAGSNAEQSGLKPDDVLLAYAGTKLNSPAELRSAIEAKQKTQPEAKESGETGVPVQVWRAGKVVDLAVRRGPLGVQPSPRPAAEAILAKRAGDRALETSRGSALAPLPGTRIETEAIARLFAEPMVLLGADASEQRLGQLAAKEHLRQFRYLHLATHGMVNNQIALYSALILAQEQSADPAKQPSDGAPVSDGRLTAEAILQNWKLDADLVVLSACQSALGKQAGGEGYLGFAQALFLAGARSLVLSLWKVDDTATALLMVRFYQNLLCKRDGLKKPMPKAEALREAKQWLRSLTLDDVEELEQQLQRRESGPSRPRPAVKARPASGPTRIRTTGLPSSSLATQTKAAHSERFGPGSETDC